MHLLFTYYTHKPGGLCTRLYRAMRAAAEGGHEVTYCTLDQPPIESHERIRITLIPFPLRTRSGLLFWALFSAWLPLWLLKEVIVRKPGRLIAFGAYYSCATALASRVARIPTTLFLRSLTFRNDALTGKPAWLRSITGWVDWIGIRAAARVICMTNCMRVEAQSFSGRILSHFALLPNDIPQGAPSVGSVSESDFPLPPRAQECSSRGGIVAVTAGVLDRRKNVGVLIEALALYRKTPGARQLHLIVAGEGAERERLEHLGEQLAPGMVSFIGWTARTAALFSSAAIALHPALHEGIPNVVLEALAVGTPVIVSDIPEHAEIFSPDVMRCAPADAEAWCHVLLRFSKEAVFREELGGACQAVRDSLTFDWDSRVLETLLE
jgi:glycosyltransferase involved in cell wall biosynthesis